MPTVLARQSRPAGEYQTPVVDVPARLQNEATRFIVTLDLHPADLSDPTLAIGMSLDGSVDGVTWMTLAAMEGWQGNIIGRNGQITPPRLTWQASDNRLLTKAQLRWTQNRTARVGVAVDTETVILPAARR